MAKTLLFYRISAVFVAKTLLSCCITAAFVAKTLPFLADFQLDSDGVGAISLTDFVSFASGGDPAHIAAEAVSPRRPPPARTSSSPRPASAAAAGPAEMAKRRRPRRPLPRR